jgi:hypothetical protein
VLTVSTALLCAVDAGGKLDASYANPSRCLERFQDAGSERIEQIVDFILVGRL